LIAPSSAVFGNSDRMLAMHDRSGLAALASSTINSVIPWMARDAVVGYHAVDVLIAGSNPILAAAAALRAVRSDLSVAVALGSSPDEWPYDLAASSRGVPLVEGVFECEERTAGNPAWRAAQVVRTLVEQSPGNVLLVPDDVMIAMADRQPAQEVLVHAWIASSEKTSDPVQRRLLSEFRSASSRRRVVCVPPGKRKTAIFAKTVVLVSMIDGFAKARGNEQGSKAITWPSDRILSFGSSAWTPAHATEAAVRMVDDLVSVSKLDLSAV
jgi:hypothetical protein